jgi:hypothetical protein
MLLATAFWAVIIFELQNTTISKKYITFCLSVRYVFFVF